MTAGVDQPQFFDQYVEPADDALLHQFGATVVIAPHPDDESLGCGGTIARLRQAGYPVQVIFVSDGSMSHPNSSQYPSDRLRQLRETEALDALRILGVESQAVSFMRLPDTQVPTPERHAFIDAVDKLAGLLADISPATVMIPWRRDPHPDHRASWQIAQAAVAKLPRKPAVVEYPIWLWELGTPADKPQPGEVHARSLAIDSVMPLKQRAIAAHQSQVTRLINDDPMAFYLSPELLRYFEIPKEVFFLS